MKSPILFDIEENSLDYSGSDVILPNGKKTFNLKDSTIGILTPLFISKYGQYLEDTYWRCRCECGNTKDIRARTLKEARSKSCGCVAEKARQTYIASKFVDITGERYGRLTVQKLHSHDKPGVYKWECVCDCGNTIILPTNALRSGNTKSCGCLLSDTSSERFSKDFSGIQFGKLKVVCYSGEHRNKQRLWKCICECGREHYVTTAGLVSGHTSSCGKCGVKEKRDRYSINIVGHKFGNLTVLERDYSIKDKRAHWMCKCDCGCTVSVMGKDLRSGKTRSCGCIRSFGEKAISEYLLKHDVNFSKQYRFEDCKDIRSLPFDFFLPNLRVCIEFDGKQHFEPVDFGGKGSDVALKQFQINTRHDAIKTEFCNSNGITLIRVSSDTLDNLDLIFKNIVSE